MDSLWPRPRLSNRNSILGMSMEPSWESGLRVFRAPSPSQGTTSTSFQKTGRGGHLLECSGKDLRVRVESLSDFHLSLPESEEFLRADLSKDTSKDLAYAEQGHKK